MQENKLFKYLDFILEKNIELILEGNMFFTENFSKILKRMRNPIATHILRYNYLDVKIDFNYLSLTDKDDSIGFVDNKKIKKWKVIDTSYSYTSNQKLYEYFNIHNTYFKRILTKDDEGEIVSIITEDKLRDFFPTWSEENFKRTICHFRSGDKDCVIDIFGLEPVVTNTKNSIKIGRFVRKFLETTNYKFSDKDIEEFVNQFKSIYELSKNAFSHFKVVKGNDIKKWYSGDNYESTSGTLGNSCMRYDKCQYYFDIYCNNDDKVSLVILMSDSVDNKISGRAILWKLDSPDKYFMDRIYTTSDSDINLFIEYAKENGWIYKSQQSSYTDVNYILGEESIFMKMNVYLNKGEYDHYPYMDTLKYYTVKSGLLCNYEDNHNYRLESTEGTNNHCDVCDGTERVSCYDCDGSGERSCSYCDGNGKEACGGCDGRGKADCDECSESGYKDCPKCDGTSEIENSEGEMVDCDDCESGQIKCDDCDGSGYITCNRCDGDGEVNCWKCDGDGTVECGDCDGSGRADCPECC